MAYRPMLLSAVSLSLVFPAFAQNAEQTTLDTISVIGLRPVPVTDTLGAVSVLDAEDLEIRAAPYLADELRAVPGVAISRSGAVGGLTQVRLRGAEANHTLLLINGIEVSDPVTGEADFGLFSGLQAAQVEVLLGEQSGLYGSDAIGGVINVVTAQKNQPFGLLEFGSFETLRADLGFGVGDDDKNLTLALGVYSTEGVDTSGNNGEEDGSQNYSFIATGEHSLGESWTLSGLVRLVSTESETDPDLNFDGLLDDANRVTEGEQTTFGLALTGDAFGFNHRLTANLNTVERDNFADNAFTNSANGERTKFSYSPSKGYEGSVFDVLLTGLIDYEAEDYTARDVNFGGATNQNERFETLGFGGEARIDFGSILVAANIRHDQNDNRFDDATTGRLSAGWDVTENHRFRASVGTGVKNPTFTELFGFFPGSFIGNPDLVPEQSTSWEIGWDGSVGPVELSATYFDAQLEDEIFTAFNPNFTSTARNRTGDSERSGVEVGARVAVSDALRLSAQVTLTDSTSDDGTDEIRVPSETASLSVDYRPAAWKGGRAGLAFDYVGEQDDFNFGTFPAQRVTLDSYVLTSASIEWPVLDDLAIMLRGENLFDEEVTDVFGFEGPGAAVFVGFKVR